MIFWGAAFSVTEVALRHTTPAFTAFSRGALGFLVMLPFLRLFGARLPRTRRLWAFAALMGLGGTALSLVGLAEGTVRAGPAIAAVLLNTAPFFVAVIAPADARRARHRPARRSASRSASPGCS